LPLFTIIIPAFNSASTIGPCLDSIIDQTLSDHEIIVMDGLSSDATIKIINERKKKCSALKLISEKDKGIYDAINKGIRESKGEWILILGSDDRIYEKETLETAAGYLRQPAPGAVYGSVFVNGDAGWAKDGEIYGGEFDVEKLLQKNICQQAVFYHRTLFDKIGYFRLDYPVCADWDFILHCAGKASLRFIPVIIAEFKGGGTSKTVTEKKFYADLPANLLAYFGLNVFRREFGVVHWRFEQFAEEQASRKKWLSSCFYRTLAKFQRRRKKSSVRDHDRRR